MSAPAQRWALLIATQHGRATGAGMPREARLSEVRQLVARAVAVATPHRVVVLIAEGFESDWRDLDAGLPPHNLLVSPRTRPPIDEVRHALAAIRARERGCSVILIPADHCAAVDTAWVTGAQEALQLAADHPNTVYLLHDKPEADPIAFEAERDMCSSTVVVGSAECLIELCHGTRPSRLVEMSIAEEAPDKDTGATGPDPTVACSGAINIIRIRSVEEYARLYRGHYARAPATAIDVRA